MATVGNATLDMGCREKRSLRLGRRTGPGSFRVMWGTDRCLSHLPVHVNPLGILLGWALTEQVWVRA